MSLQSWEQMLFDVFYKVPFGTFDYVLHTQDVFHYTPSDIHGQNDYHANFYCVSVVKPFILALAKSFYQIIACAHFDRSGMSKTSAS